MKLIQQQSPLKRLLIICCPHLQGYSTSGSSQGPAISFSLDSESYSYTVNAFLFFFLKANYSFASVQFSSVQLLSCVRLFATPWTTASQASLSITNSWCLLELMSIELVDAIQPSHPLSSPSPPAFSLCQHQGLFK